MKEKILGILICMLLITTTVTILPEIKADSGESSIGYELLDNNTVLHIWNNHDNYYFDVDSGIQLTNYYNEYWSHNVLMLGYYNNDEWNLIYHIDELSGFNKDIDTDDETYINATLWKDLTYQGYDFRLAIRYHLGVNDNDLIIIPYIKNLGIAIPFQICFGWEMKDINIANVTNDNYLQIYNNTDKSFDRILLNKIIDKSFTDLDLNTTIQLICTNPPSPYLSRNLYLEWNYTLNYKVTVKNRAGQYNAPVTLFIRVGTLDVGQEKSTEMHWLDADDWLGISSDELDSFCGEEATGTLANALDGLDRWEHYDDETHCFVLDLGEIYAISKVRGRSDGVSDPTDVNIYIDNNNPPTTLVKEGITTWQDTSDWIEIALTAKAIGRYIKVEIIITEQPGGEIEWGRRMRSFTIFDAYGDVATPYEIVWEEDWLDGNVSDTMGGKVATDSNNNVIVYVFSEAIEQNIIIKYDSNGTLIWEISVNDSGLESINLESYTQEPQMPIGYENCTSNITRIRNDEIFELQSICTDEDDNIILIGDLWNKTSDQYYTVALKYDQNGSEIWKNKYDYNGKLQPGADSIVDSDGSIFIPVLYFIWSYGLKLDSDGSVDWIKLVSIRPFWWALSVALDSNENPIVASIDCLIDPYGSTLPLRLTKFNSNTGNKIADSELTILHRGTVFPDSALSVDTSDNSVFFGFIDYIYKIDSSFSQIIWQKYHTLYIYDLAVINEKLIVCGGWCSVNDVINYYSAAYNKNSGIKLFDMVLGELLYSDDPFFQEYFNHLKGISMDTQGDILFAGGQGGIKILKVRMFA